MRLTLTILTLLTLGLCAQAQVTTRRGLKLEKKTETVAADTVTADSSSFSVFGYEKTLRATSESFFVTNLTTDTITTLIGEIEYLTLDGRQLHRRKFSTDVNLPPGETRQITLPAWDKQKVWYYHRSSAPRSRTQATPYTIRLSLPTYITTKPHTPNKIP